MPIPVLECPDVYHCGFSSKDSFGSTAYLIVRSSGNVMVDSPRFDRQLLKQIQVNAVFLGQPGKEHGACQRLLLCTTQTCSLVFDTSGHLCVADLNVTQA